jgi:hypothetical protein
MANGRPLVTEDLVRGLSGSELEFAFAMAIDFQVIGRSDGAFAICDGATGHLHIFNGDDTSFTDSSFNTNLVSTVLNTGQRLQAVVSSKDMVVSCKIGDIDATGKDFVDAIMKAVVLFKLQGGNKSGP